MPNDLHPRPNLVRCESRSANFPGTLPFRGAIRLPNANDAASRYPEQMPRC